MGGTDVRLAHQLPGQPVAGARGKYINSMFIKPIIERIG